MIQLDGIVKLRLNSSKINRTKIRIWWIWLWFWTFPVLLQAPSPHSFRYIHFGNYFIDTRSCPGSLLATVATFLSARTICIVDLAKTEWLWIIDQKIELVKRVVLSLPMRNCHSRPSSVLMDHRVTWEMVAPCHTQTNFSPFKEVVADCCITCTIYMMKEHV